MRKRWALLAAPPAALVLALVPVLGLGVLAEQSVPTSPQAGASVAASTEIPPVALAAYRAAAPLCPGLDWTVLAGIGKEETGHGTAAGHHLDADGQAQPPGLHSAAGNGALGYAWGPMQFLASTWASYGPRVAPGLDNADMNAGPVQNVRYAAQAAALLLCAAAGGQVTSATVWAAVDAYSGHTDGYADDVRTLAGLYGTPSPPADAGSGVTGANATAVGMRIVLAAIHFVGAPYADGNPADGDPGIQYSGHPPGPWIEHHFALADPAYTTLDCSGLVNVTMKVAFGLDLDYCSSDYLRDSRFTHVSMSQLEEGDLVAFGNCGLGVPGHIAIVASYDPATGMASTIEASRHGTVVGFRAQQSVATWAFTSAVRYTG